MPLDFIISPHGVCDSCNGHSGPKISLHALRGISPAHRNNELPTGVDLQMTLDDIRDAQIDIDSLDNEIRYLRETLQVLEERRAKLQDFRDHEKSLFSPIRKLPDDVLKAIFMICQNVFERKPGYIHFTNPRTFVRTVTQVSAYWRNTAMSLPLLWSRISFHNYKSGYDKRMAISPGDFLNSCLVLSGSAPLSIEFGTYNYSRLEDMGDSCLKQLAMSAQRWDNITTNIDTIKLDYVMKYVPTQTVFSCLRSLGPFESSKPLTLYSTPALTHLSCKNIRRLVSLNAPPLLANIDISTSESSENSPQDVLVGLSWSQITHLRCDSHFHTGKLSPFLNSMPDLCSLTINLNYKFQLSTFITLPRLETLTFVTSRGTGTSSNKPLKYFVTPSLKELTMEGKCDSDSRLIQDLLSRSRCKIEKLSIAGNMLLEGCWHGAQVENVKHLILHLQGSRSCKEVMLILAYQCTNRPRSIFPGMETVEFILFGNFFPGGNAFPVEGFIGVVNARLPPMTRRREAIKSVTLRFHYTLDQVYVNRINDFCTSDIIRQSGVDIVLINRYSLREIDAHEEVFL